MKSKHTQAQQLVFLKGIQEAIDDKFLDMEIRSRMNGTDLAKKKYLESMDSPSIEKQEAKEYLWTYMRLNNLKQENLNNAVSGSYITIENELDATALIDNLNSYLEQLNLPTL